jgi:hypothetical protein
MSHNVPAIKFTRRTCHLVNNHCKHSNRLHCFKGVKQLDVGHHTNLPDVHGQTVRDSAQAEEICGQQCTRKG